MHRISYILYNYEKDFKPADFYIVGSNKLLLNYITSVLPDLDVNGVRQMTMEELFVRLLYEDWDRDTQNIAPLAISYEYDPCDFLKAREFQLKRDIEGYKKTTQDDLINMQTGLFGYKGKVHFQVASCINDELEQIDRSLPKPELFAAISACIDQRIYRNYRMYPGNYVAYDWLNGTTEFTGIYSQEEKQQFVGYIEQQLGKIEIPNKDEAFLREKLLLMYANPLINHLAACR